MSFKLSSSQLPSVFAVATSVLQLRLMLGVFKAPKTNDVNRRRREDRTGTMTGANIRKKVWSTDSTNQAKLAFKATITPTVSDSV
ncbi:hypothetical protein F2Q69_00048362 [Brassica cretica]|uniref:Uncharacterized protein n=1 Tax=Brassica cretica TaxID=69181 RepID=A0A8S9PUL3_BRACR|nr:hypothetical protein F2Q69_00048362 [Brassica cretica]